MKLSFRPILSEQQLENLERLTHSTWQTRSIFKAYREAAEHVKQAGRDADLEAYQKASKKLENERERVDWAVGSKRR